MKMEISKTGMVALRKKIEGHEAIVGILQDKEHKFPLSYRLHGHKAFHGTMARKISPTPSPFASVNTVANDMQREHKFLTRPFSKKKNRDIIKLSRLFYQAIMDSAHTRRFENWLQAVIRNPILRKDYGENTQKTIGSKGFSHPMIDTGQFFKNIKAKLIRKKNV